MKASKLYRLEVAPVIILPLGKSPFFSYISDEVIGPGSLVAISFGKRSLEGVVYDCAPLPGKAPTWMKSITKVLKRQFLTREQLELARFVSEEYFTSLGKTLKHFIPKQTSLKKEKSIPTKKGASRLNSADSAVLKKFLLLGKQTPGYLNIHTLQSQSSFFSHLVKKMSSLKKQTLILVPEILLLPLYRDMLAEYIASEKIAILHSKRADGQYGGAWEKIRSGEASIILATRQGLFAPFHDLGMLVILEEQDESYKQWTMSPRYDGKRVAKKLAQLFDAKMLLVSGTPGIDSMFHIQKKDYKILHKNPPLPPLMPALEIVNLRLERFRKNYSPLSEALILALHETRSRGEQALLYIHRQGMNAFSVCENCKNIFRCPESGHVLASRQNGTFRCSGCTYTTGSFPSCPSCGHLSFRHVGFGTERIEREVRKMFPGARIFRADKTTLRTEKHMEKFYQDASQGKIDILIGTQAILKSHALPKLSLVGMIDADSLLSIPDFRADEKLFLILNRFREEAGREKGRKHFPKIIVQTFHPESTFFQRITVLDSNAYLQKILAERADLFYPPYARLFSLACRGIDEKQTLEMAQAMGSELQKILSKERLSYRLSVPESARQIHLKKKLFESTLTLRISTENKLPETVRAYLEKRNMSDIIDVDPLTLS